MTTSNKSSAALSILTALLLAIAIGNAYWILPQFRTLFASAGIIISFPARLAFAISQVSAMLFAIAIGAIIVARRREGKGAPGAFSSALTTVALLTSVYIGLVCTVYFDYARTVARIR